MKSLTYDDASRLATVTQGNRVATHTHGDALDTIDQVRIASSGTERYRLSRVHDNLGRVTRIDTLGNETTLHARRDYLHNNANQRTEVTEDSGRKWSFDYDSLGQVTTAQKLDAASEVLPGFDFAYAFDDIGNRSSTTVNERTASYSTNAINQYTQRDYPGAVDVRGHAPEHVGVIVNSERTERTDGDFYAPAIGDNSAASVELDIVVKALDPGPPELLAEESRTALLPQDPESFTYDLDGNLTQDGLWTYEWDAENRLVAMESRSDLPATVTRQRLEFAYDSRSRRIQKTVKDYDSGTSSWATTAQIKFLYDGWNLLAEYDALSGDALIRSHVWGLDLSGTPQGVGGVGGLLWSSHSGTDYAPGFDGNGNIIAWVNLSDGTLAGTAEYGAFGETLITSGISAQLPFGFSTKYEDAETGLIDYGYRFYAPSLGRWLNRDILGEWAAFQSMNQEVFSPSDYYQALPLVFVSNDPIGQVDLVGLRGVPTVPGTPPSNPMQPPNAGPIGAGAELFSELAGGASGAIGDKNKNLLIRQALRECGRAAAGQDCGLIRSLCCCCRIFVSGSEFAGGGDRIWNRSSGTFEKVGCDKMRDSDRGSFTSFLINLPRSRTFIFDSEER